MKNPITINFNLGTLEISGQGEQISSINHLIIYDKRTKNFRAEAYLYSDIILTLRKENVPHIDNAKAFDSIDIKLENNFTPRSYQQEALKAWIREGYKGIISLPTGSGKSFLAQMAVNFLKRPTLIIVPTIDLMHQWANQIKTSFNIEPGYLGGGLKEIKDITISTYDSAVIQMEFIGNRFGFLIFDECHHLPGPSNRLSASMSIAPYRMGLSATPESDEEYDNILHQLIGPLMH